MLDYEVIIRVPVGSLRAVLEKFAESAVQPVTEVGVLTLPDGLPLALPGKLFGPFSEAAKAVGILGSTCGLMSIAVDDLLRELLANFDERTVTTADGVFVKLDMWCSVSARDDRAEVRLWSTTSSQCRAVVESPSFRAFHRKLLEVGGPGSVAWLVRETEWEQLAPVDES